MSPVPGLILDPGWLDQHVNHDEMKEAASNIQQIDAELKAQGDKRRLEESIFVHVFLPMFLGTPMEQRQYKVDLPNWVAYAGNPYWEVDVIDTKGTVLFTVPPIFDRSAISPSDAARHAGRGGIMDVIMMTQKLQLVSPVQAKYYLNQEMRQRAVGMVQMDNVLVFLRTWNAIFKRYGKPTILDLLEDTETGQQEAPRDAQRRSLDDEDWELL